MSKMKETYGIVQIQSQFFIHKKHLLQYFSLVNKQKMEYLRSVVAYQTSEEYKNPWEGCCIWF